MSELQVSVEVRAVEDDDWFQVELTSNDDDYLHIGGFDTKEEAEAERDRWRVALRNIDGPEHELAMTQYCVEHDCLFDVHQDRDRCGYAASRRVGLAKSGSVCRIVPLFFRDIKDEPEGKE